MRKSIGSVSQFVAILVLVPVLGSVVPGAIAEACPVPGNPWVCEPDPQAGVTPALTTCVSQCVTDTYHVAAAEGDDVIVPAVWLTLCDVQVGSVTASVLFAVAGDDPTSCNGVGTYNGAIEPIPLVPRNEALEIQGSRSVTVTIGLCRVEAHATVYGWGTAEWFPVPCGIIA